jgi:hypothetical protein
MSAPCMAPTSTCHSFIHSFIRGSKQWLARRPEDRPLRRCAGSVAYLPVSVLVPASQILYGINYDLSKFNLGGFGVSQSYRQIQKPPSENAPASRPPGIFNS